MECSYFDASTFITLENLYISLFNYPLHVVNILKRPALSSELKGG